MSEFVSAPAPSGGIQWDEHKGKLLIVEPLSVEHDIETRFGKSDAVRANVYVLTGPDDAEEFIDTLIFPKILQSQTRGQIGKKVVGRLTQGEQKSTQSPPWVIAEASSDDIEKAKAYLSKQTLTSAAAPF